MNAALAFIALCVIGAGMIEVRSRYSMRNIINRRIAALDLANETVHAQRDGEKVKADNREQKNIHLVSPLPASDTRETL